MEYDSGRLLPFYLVVDVSPAMAEGERHEAACAIMPAVRRALSTVPVVGDRVRFGVVDFAGQARIRLPLSDLLDDGVRLPARTDGTCYGSAFRLLCQEIESDVKQPACDGFAVHRPVVFFLAGGPPTDPADQWQTDFAVLTRHDPLTGQGFPAFPNVVPCGVADADPLVLQSLVYPVAGPGPMRMYLMDEGAGPAAAIRSITGVLVDTVLGTGTGLAGGDSGIVLPAPDRVAAGVTGYPADAPDFV